MRSLLLNFLKFIGALQAMMVLSCLGAAMTMVLKTSLAAENTGFVLHSSCTRLIDVDAACHLRSPVVLSAAAQIDQIARLERSVIQLVFTRFLFGCYHSH